MVVVFFGWKSGFCQPSLSAFKGGSVSMRKQDLFMAPGGLGCVIKRRDNRAPAQPVWPEQGGEDKSSQEHFEA